MNVLELAIIVVQEVEPFNNLSCLVLASPSFSLTLAEWKLGVTLESACGNVIVASSPHQ